MAFSHFDQSDLPKIQPERQPQGNSHQKVAEQGSPHVRQLIASAVCQNCDPQYDGGDDHVQTEECSNAVGEEQLDKKWQVQSVLLQKGNELGIGKHNSHQAECDVAVTDLHGDLRP